MTQSITYFVDVELALEGVGPQPSGFGTPMLVHESNVSPGSRLHGPFTSVSDVLDFGYASGSPPHLFAQAIVRQNPRARQFYVGRQDSGDANLDATMNAIFAANPSAWYLAMHEDRSAATNKALAEWTESRFKIAIAQSSAASLIDGLGRSYTATVGGTEADGNYDLIFTGFGLSSPATVRVTRSTTPASNDDLAAAIEAELVAQNTGSGDIEGLLAAVDSTGAVVSFSMTDGIPLGTITSAAPGGATLTVAIVDADIGHDFFLSQYTRTALLYHPTDAEFLDASWASRCLSFNLDQRKGIWAHKQLSGIPATNLTNAQAAAIRAVNANYFAPAALTAGNLTLPFTAQGWMPFGAAGAGRRIDVVTTLDWARARLEEALSRVLFSETHGIPFDDAGINRFYAATRGHFDDGARAGHYQPTVVPEGEEFAGVSTPAIFMPRFSEISAQDRQDRILRFTALVYLRGAIERVQFNVGVKQ